LHALLIIRAPRPALAKQLANVAGITDRETGKKNFAISKNEEEKNSSVMHELVCRMEQTSLKCLTERILAQVKYDAWLEGDRKKAFDPELLKLLKYRCVLPD
jgi:hypothetical protein